MRIPNRPSKSATLVALGLIVAFGAAARLLLQAHAPAFLGGDSVDYVVGGYRLYSGQGLELPLKRAPGYPLFLAAGMTLVGPRLELLALIQHGLGLGTIVLAFLLGTTAFNRTVGLLAAFGVAINGDLLQMEQTMLSEALGTPLLMLTLLTALLALRSGRRSTFAALGVVLGLTMLARPAVQASLPLLLAAIALARPAPRQSLVAIGLVLGCCALVIIPWLLRNQRTYGLATISSGLGEALYARVRQHDDAFEFRDRGEPPADPYQARVRATVFELAQRYKYNWEIREKLRRELRLGELEADRALRDASLQVISQEPGRYLRGTLDMSWRLLIGADKSLSSLWSSRTRADRARDWPSDLRWLLEQPFPNDPADFAVADRLIDLYEDDRLTALLVPFLTLGSMACLTGRRRGLPLLPLVLFSQLLLYAAVDGPLSRYRYVFQPLITLLALGGASVLVQHAWTRLQHARERRALPSRRLTGA